VSGGRQRLDWGQLVEALDGLAGRRVAIRIVELGPPEQLVLVVHGTLGRASNEKRPSAFWPLNGAHPGELEQPGVYLSQDDFAGAEWRPGGVLVVRRGETLVNVRPL
jgi:hypothetical protein